MSTITYREIVRLVHPDLNPGIQDAGAKMAEIQRNKNNPSILFQLAARWGLVNGGSSHTHTNSTWSSFSENHRESRRESDFRGDSYGNVTYLHHEDGVILRFKRRLVFGKIKNIQTVKKGKRKGWFRLTVALTDGRVVFVQKPSLVSGSEITKYEGFGTSQGARADETWNRWIENENRRKRAKESEKAAKADSIKDTLGMNRNFRDRDVWAYVRTKGNWFRVSRTTEKSVFYWDWDGKERRCQFSSVSRVDI